MKTFHLGIAQLGESEGIDEIDNAGQGFLDSRLRRARSSESQNCALPKILVAALGHRNIELTANATLNAFEHTPFALERMVLRNHQLELKDSHDHGLTEFGRGQSLILNPAHARRLAALGHWVDTPHDRNTLVSFDNVTLFDVLETFQ